MAESSGRKKALSDDGQEPQDENMLHDVQFIQNNYKKYYSQFVVEQESEHFCVFRMSSKTNPERVVRIQVQAPMGFQVLEDAQAQAIGKTVLTGRIFESFEQLMSSMDQGGFGDMLCGLVAAKLQEHGTNQEAE